MLAAGVDHIDNAFHADIEHQLRRAVKELGAVDIGEMMHLVDAAHRIRRGRRGAPRELSSSTRTAQPSRSNRFTRAEPMNPLPPVTRTRRGLTRVPPLPAFQAA